MPMRFIALRSVCAMQLDLGRRRRRNRASRRGCETWEGPFEDPTRRLPQAPDARRRGGEPHEAMAGALRRARVAARYEGAQTPRRATALAAPAGH